MRRSFIQKTNLVLSTFKIRELGEDESHSYKLYLHSCRNRIFKAKEDHYFFRVTRRHLSDLKKPWGDIALMNTFDKYTTFPKLIIKLYNSLLPDAKEIFEHPLEDLNPRPDEILDM
jgi:hypothetical protein